MPQNIIYTLCFMVPICSGSSLKALYVVPLNIFSHLWLLKLFNYNWKHAGLARASCLRPICEKAWSFSFACFNLNNLSKLQTQWLYFAIPFPCDVAFCSLSIWRPEKFKSHPREPAICNRLASICACHSSYCPPLSPVPSTLNHFRTFLPTCIYSFSHCEP